MDKRQVNDKENYNLLIAKKTEKIVTAIYLISQFLSREENLKHDLRKSANDLLKNINSIAYTDLNQDDTKNLFVIYKLCLDNVSLIISYLFVARDANLISRMNADIVIEGLRVLENILIKKQFNFSRESILITEEISLLNFNNFESDKNNLNTSFDVLTERNVVINEKIEKNKNNSFEKIKEIENLKDENEKEIFSPEIKILENRSKSKADFYKGQNIKDNIYKRRSIQNKDENKALKEKSLKTINRKNNRKEQIISLFTKGVEVSINDIAKKVVGCSTKTLQRELNNLVQEKKIQRIGDKRWSKYILA
jgi:hypothetical protein